MNKYEKLSKLRKDGQKDGTIPDWYTTAGVQLVYDRYLYQADTIKEQYERIARTAAKHTSNPEDWERRFFEVLWKGWLSPSTPILSNMGTDRGLPVSCSGQVIDDSIYGFYESHKESAILIKQGFGTSVYLGDIRARGTDISVGGKADGVLPVFVDFVRVNRNVSQAGVRRGAGAAYIEPQHGDFYELLNYIKNNPDDANIGWVINDDFINGLDNGNQDYIERYQAMMNMKMIIGKGYFFFVDKVNRMKPQAYINNNLDVRASNLCAEIALFSDKDHTFTCVLSSMNISKYDEWKYTDAAYVSMVFLDCVVSEFIEKAKLIPGMERAVKFTEKGRATGLGSCGLGTYFQDKMVEWGSAESFELNDEIFSHINAESLRASQDLAREYGEPEWCKGLGIRNTHRMTQPPTKSTAAIMGGISEGINPDPAMVFTQLTAAGEIDRVNGALLKIMKERGIYDDEHIKDIRLNGGSVQHVDWLSEYEKRVFKTGFEISQYTLIDMVSARQPHNCQAQSANLFLRHDADEAHISAIHEYGFKDPFLPSMYYIYSTSGVGASTGSKSEPKICEACQ